MATSLRSLCVSIALLALALAAQSKKNEDLITSLGSITRRHMDASSGFSSTQEYLQSVASARRPLVVTGYDVDLSKWDLDALAKKGGGGVILDNVRRNRGSKSGETGTCKASLWISHRLAALTQQIFFFALIARIR